METNTQSFRGDLPDSIPDLLGLQKTLIVELTKRNKAYRGTDEEVVFLKEQNKLIRNQIDYLYTMMDQLCSDRHLGSDMGPFGLA